MTIDHRVALVTPVLAHEWLERFNSNNRRMRPGHVLDLQGRMETGKWVANGQPIIFGSNNKLLDGQHRLQACVDSGVTIETSIMEGVDPQTFPTIDDGVNRSAGDVLGLSHYDNPTPLASAARWLFKYANGTMKSKQVANNGVVLGIVASNTDLVKCLDVIMPVKNRLGLGKGLLSALHCVFSRLDTTDADRFLTGLLHGTNLQPDSPILLLRTRLTDAVNPRYRMGTRTRLTDIEKAALTVKAWNFFRQGKAVKQLRFRSTGPIERREAFPVAG